MLPLHANLKFRQVNIDSLAQLVEHNTFNVGVMGSSPMRVTRRISATKSSFLFIYSHSRFSEVFLEFEFINRFGNCKLPKQTSITTLNSP